MRIAFAEVRDKTVLFSAVAGRLADCDVSWLIQNRAFANSSMRNATVLPYPRRSDLRSPSIPGDEAERLFASVAATDRFPTHFGHPTNHYPWYFDQISRWLDSTAPDMIVGEVGNFHSHLLALLAEERGIPFVNPVSSRYPTGRFAFFLGDRLVPVGGSGDALPVTDVDVVVNEVSTGARVPDYMKVKARRLDKAAYRYRILREWVRGERFATQSPSEFVSSALARRRAAAQWESRAIGVDELTRMERGTVILYPLQMQPELNLDVWGREHRDQAATIESLLTSVGDDGVVVVKPNPKSFHEMSADLNRRVGNSANLVRLVHNSTMRDVIQHCDLVVTVSGTVAIERLLRREPVVIALDDYARWLGVPTMGEMGVTLDNLGRDEISRVTQIQSEAVDPRAVVARLVATSYEGMISEPLLAPQVLNDENVGLIARAIRDVVPAASSAIGTAA